MIYPTYLPQDPLEEQPLEDDEEETDDTEGNPDDMEGNPDETEGSPDEMTGSPDDMAGMGLVNCCLDPQPPNLPALLEYDGRLFLLQEGIMLPIIVP